MELKKRRRISLNQHFSGSFQTIEKNNLLSETPAEDEESENCIDGFEDNEDNFPDEKKIYCSAFI